MSRSAMPATRNEAMRPWKPPKVTPFAELTIGRGHTALTRTVADGWGWLPRVKRELLLRIREKMQTHMRVSINGLEWKILLKLKCTPIYRNLHMGISHGI